MSLKILHNLLTNISDCVILIYNKGVLSNVEIRYVMKKREENSRQDSLNNFEAQFKRSTIPLLVLQLLSEHEMYAYEMIQETLKVSDGIRF